MKKLIFFTIFTTFSFDALSQTKPNIPFCEPEIFRNLKEANSLAQWLFIPAAQPDDEVYRTPTKKIGQWVELKIKKDSVVLVHFNSKEMLSWTFTKQNCKPESVKETKSFVELNPNGFNDADLEKIVAQKKITMIYIWNPSAFHSVDKYLIYKAEAKKRNYNIISLLAPQADEKWAVSEIKKKKLDLSTRQLSSLELIMRGGNLHYPSVFFVHDGKFSKRLMGGLEKNNVSRFFDQFTKDNSND